MISRRKTRIAVFQALYADIFIKNLDLETFRQSYEDENPLDFSVIDEQYFVQIRQIVHQHSALFLAIIVDLASKFDIEKMPKTHIIILMISFAEMMFWQSDIIDPKISINEAIVLAKKFSDDSGAKFISGTLGSFLRNQEKYQNIEPLSSQFFL